MNYELNIQFKIVVKTGQAYSATLEIYAIEG